MGEKSRQSRFNGNAWFDCQVHHRTRAALTERGSAASTHSQEYKAEYARQYALFRRERAEVKRRKREKHLARMKKQTTTDCVGV